MKTIILPTDFSENARYAVKFAFELFDNESTEFILVHSYEPPHPTGMLINIDDIIRKDALSGLKNEENIIKRDFPGLKGKLTTMAQIGEINEALDVVCKAKKGDIIVMGTKGASGLKEILLGSNAAAVIESSSSSVLAVPSNARITRPKVIVCAADYENLEGIDALIPLRNMAKEFGAEIIFVNVTEDDKGELSFNPVIEKLALDEFFADVNHSYQDVKADNVIDGLNNFLDENNADLLAMLPNKTNFFSKIFHRSVTKRMVLHTQIPLLALRE